MSKFLSPKTLGTARPYRKTPTPSPTPPINLIPKLPSPSPQFLPPPNPPASNPLYNFLPATQNPNNFVNLVTYCLKQSKRENYKFSLPQNALNALLPHLGSHQISRVLLRCQSDPSSALTFFKWVRTDMGLCPSLDNYCHIVHILTWSKRFKPAMKFLEEIIQNGGDEDLFGNLASCCEGCNWDPVVFDMLIKAYLKLGMVKEGFRVYTKTVNAGYSVSVIACNFLLDGLLKSNCFRHCWKVYEEMERIGVRPNTFTFNILTNAFCKDDGDDKVMFFLEKMEEEEGFEPDIVTYNTLIGSYCRRGRMDDAFNLYRIMYIRGVFPDLVTITALMNGLCIQGRTREGHQLLRKMTDQDLNPDFVVYNTLISGYCREGKMQEAKFLLLEMVGRGIFPDCFTCRVMVDGYKRLGRLLPGLNLVVELEKFGVSVPSHIYDLLIVTLCDEDRPIAANSLLTRISQQLGYKPDTVIYNKLIGSLCQKGSLVEALLLKDELAGGDMRPDLATYQSLVCCLSREGRMVEAESLVEEMRQSGELPGPEICRALVRGYCKEGAVEKAASTMELFAKELQVYDSESYNILVENISKDGDVARFLMLQKRMLKVGLAPNSLTCYHMVHKMWKMTGVKKHKQLVEG